MYVRSRHSASTISAMWTGIGIKLIIRRPYVSWPGGAGCLCGVI